MERHDRIITDSKRDAKIIYRGAVTPPKINLSS
jgi:hypothetical protein